ncbi:hypothetical protein BC936DRAFT_144915 [Jimgerdemannia flammicorona]|uniref:Uncharacterized protein n=2 Tax=Jimgerdemannia flammicorona TaxID=994334 RepID=A0A433DBD9_9FUNG|nr:hypothetical protein BC936DRAFT_144915 [Jimgerdemannia flammicorona]RUS28404.1 hypothetical protein BC938DRAFT_481925 [Jimgerdemannia flammicorona]
MNPFAINISPSPKEIRLYLVILLLTTLTLLWRNTLYSYITAYTPSTPLIISLVPHSHCDAGWNKPLNDYYDQDVKYILQRVTLELLRNPARRFVWSDLQYVVTWLHEDGDNRVSPNTSSDVREFLARDGDTAVKFLESRATWRQLMGGEKGEGVTWRRLMWWLVHGGQFEFVGGGWIGHDEALVTPSSMVDNMEVGLEWLKREFGIDPFGDWHRFLRYFRCHSDVTPVIFKQMGYDAMIMGRIDNRLRDKWSAQR